MDVFEKIEKSVVENIRLALIEAGLTVDITAYTTVLAYESAMDALNTSLALTGMEVVYIKGNTIGEYKYTKTGSYFSIESLNISDGSFGSFNCAFLEAATTDTFNKVQLPDAPVDVDFTVRIVTANLKVYRTLRSLLFNIFGTLRYVPMLADDLTLTGGKCLAMYRGKAEPNSEDFKEFVGMYTLKDVWPTEFRIIEAGLPKLTVINPTIEVGNNI
jgi:hypothetical protein